MGFVTGERASGRECATGGTTGRGDDCGSAGRVDGTPEGVERRTRDERHSSKKKQQIRE
jgi:hypothetical protein